jgi:hypothetical protein
MVTGTGDADPGPEAVKAPTEGSPGAPGTPIPPAG